MLIIGMDILWYINIYENIYILIKVKYIIKKNENR
jgi:hypothetical protein